MLTKPELLFAIVEHEALLYEAACGGPRKYGKAVEYLNENIGRLNFNNGEAVYSMAQQYLEWTYREGPTPRWWPEV